MNPLIDKEARKQRREQYYNVGRKLRELNPELFAEMAQVNTITDINRIGELHKLFSSLKRDSNCKAINVDNRRVFIYVVLMLMDKDVLLCRKKAKKGLSMRLGQVLVVPTSRISIHIAELNAQLKIYPKFAQECEEMYQKIKIGYENKRF